jgi:hypothetical protein
MLPSNGHLSRAGGTLPAAPAHSTDLDADHGAFASALAAHTITWRGHAVQGAITVTPRGIECLTHRPGPAWEASYSFRRAGVGSTLGLWLNLRYQIPAPGTAPLRFTLLGSAPLSALGHSTRTDHRKPPAAHHAGSASASDQPRHDVPAACDQDPMFYLAMVAGSVVPPLRSPAADADARAAAVAPAMAARGERRCRSGAACRRPGEAVCGGRHCLPHSASVDGR